MEPFSYVRFELLDGFYDAPIHGTVPEYRRFDDAENSHMTYSYFELAVLDIVEVRLYVASSGRD
jgi:hypothetical protein